MTIPEIIDLLHKANNCRATAREWVRQGHLELADSSWKKYREYEAQSKDGFKTLNKKIEAE